MRTKKYTSISLPPRTIHELELWQEAYRKVGKKLTKERLIDVILEKHRRSLWRDKEEGQQIVTCYKALNLAERDGIDFRTAFKLVYKHDREIDYTGPYTRTSDYVYDRGIYGIKTK